MRYGPHTAAIEHFLEWLAGTDAARVKLTLENDPRPRSPETQAALKRHSDAPGLGATWLSAVEKDWRKIMGDLARGGVFTDSMQQGDFRHLVSVGTKVLVHRDRLSPGDDELIFAPFAAAGYHLPPEGTRHD